MADHLGHSVNIHTSVYRLQSNLIERTKVSKILMAFENGGIAKTAEVRQLDEIEVPVNGKLTYPQHCSYNAYTYAFRIC